MLAAEKNKSKSKKSKKPLGPKEKGIVIRETNSSEINKPKTRDNI